MTRAYKLVGGEKTDNSKKFVVWATCPIHAMTILKNKGYRYDFKIYRLAEADHIRHMELMTWDSYLAMEQVNDTERQDIR